MSPTGGATAPGGLPARPDPEVLCADLERTLSTVWADRAAMLPLEDATRGLRQAPTLDSYSLPGAFIAELAHALSPARVSAEARSTYLKAILARLLRDLDTRLDAERLPAAIRTRILGEAERIAWELTTQSASFYELANDRFLKDLAILLLRLLPCGAELVQVRAGVPRRLLVRGGVLQLLRGIGFFGIRTRGFEPFLSLHMDNRQLDDFTPEGWDATYLRIADLLRVRADLKGVFGTAWFYDPAMEWVSPHLAYLRQRRLEGGAAGFTYGPTDSALKNALTRSQRRRTLHEQGQYTPVSYYLVWSRSDLLKWADLRPASGS